MSKSQDKSRTKQPETRRFSRRTILVIGVVIVACIAVIGGVVLLKEGPVGQPLTAVNQTGSATDAFNTASALYSQSVDLANAGNYKTALDDADKALAQNVSSLTPLIQANRAGILVAMGQYVDAITAADAAIGVEGNLTTTHAIAWYNKANALAALGRTAEANAAYSNASALDPTLKHP